MPIRLSDIEQHGVPVSFQPEGSVMVRVGPCSATPLLAEKIPLDGRHYICAGKLILKNGMSLRSNFEINTHTFDFLERDTVRIFLDAEQAWYAMEEEELFELIGVIKEDAMPYVWVPDMPLDYFDPGPYPMNWPDQ
jgi:hypothetical protein